MEHHICETPTLTNVSIQIITLTFNLQKIVYVGVEHLTIISSSSPSTLTHSLHLTFFIRQKCAPPILPCPEIITTSQGTRLQFKVLPRPPNNTSHPPGSGTTNKLTSQHTIVCTMHQNPWCKIRLKMRTLTSGIKIIKFLY